MEVTWPVGPEVGSTICWAGGQALGGIFIVISDALQDADNADPPLNLSRALVFEAVIACAVVPTAMALGLVGGGVRNRRLEVDKDAGRVEGGREETEGVA